LHVGAIRLSIRLEAAAVIGFGRSMGTMSWNEAYASHYDEWSAHMTADVPFYVELARKADGPLVELAIGNGRVAIPVARATG